MKRSSRRNCKIFSFFSFNQSYTQFFYVLYESNEVYADNGDDLPYAIANKQNSSKATTSKQNSFRRPPLHAVRKNAYEPRKTERGKRIESKEFQGGEGITNSRMNLLRALNRVKHEEKDFDDHSISRSDEEFSGKSSFDGVEDLEVFHFAKTRKRKSPSGIHSEESSDSDYMKYYPNLPEEPSSKDEYNQVEFLEMFKLITPETLEKIKTRRSERKKRTCTKNQKTDFHYGNFDLNEV